VIGAEPAAIQLRFLQTVSEIASEKNSTTFFPLPIELLRAFGGTGAGPGDRGAAAPAGGSAAPAKDALSATGPRPSLGSRPPEPSLPPAREAAVQEPRD
jgi:hypothetical protein